MSRRIFPAPCPFGLGVPAALVEAERREMVDVRIGKTASRHVLRSMTDFSCLLDGYRGDPLDDEARGDSVSAPTRTVRRIS